MVWMKHETVASSIGENLMYLLVGATLGLSYGCSRESAYFEKKYQEKLRETYSDIQTIVPKSKQDDLEKIIMEAKW